MPMPETMQAQMMRQILAQRLGIDPSADLSAMIANHPDPTVRMLAQMRQQAAETEDEQVTIEAEPVAPVGPDPPRPDQLRLRIGALKAEVGRLRAVNDRVAAALGACFLCWGEDLGCPERDYPLDGPRG